MFKQYAVLGIILTLAAGAAWHKHVVHQRDAAQTEITALARSLETTSNALSASERLRATEAKAAKADAEAARTDADRRVAEARRSAGAIKKLVEKPRVHSIVPAGTACPGAVSDVVSAGELRDALQPDPFRPSAAPGSVSVPAPAPGAGDPEHVGYRAPLDAGERGGDGQFPELGLGSPGVGTGSGPSAGGPLF